MKLTYKGCNWLNLLLIIMIELSKFSTICRLNPTARSIYSAACSQVGRSSKVTGRIFVRHCSENTIVITTICLPESSHESISIRILLSGQVQKLETISTCTFFFKVHRNKPAADPKTPLKSARLTRVVCCRLDSMSFPNLVKSWILLAYWSWHWERWELTWTHKNAMSKNNPIGSKRWIS